MKAIKTTIIFDCIGVICTKPLQSWFCANLGKWEDCKEYFYEVARRFDLAIISEMELMDELGKKVGRTKEEVRKEVDEYFVLNDELIEYIHELKDRGYKLGFLSNGSHVALERRIFSTRPWFKPLFHSFIVSSEVGMVKPDAEIYNHALNSLGSSAHETIFIDDSEENIIGAEAVGISGIVYESVSQLKKELKEFEI